MEEYVNDWVDWINSVGYKSHKPIITTRTICNYVGVYTSNPGTKIIFSNDEWLLFFYAVCKDNDMFVFFKQEYKERRKYETPEIKIEGEFISFKPAGKSPSTNLEIPIPDGFRKFREFVDRVKGGVAKIKTQPSEDEEKMRMIRKINKGLIDEGITYHSINDMRRVLKIARVFSRKSSFPMYAHNLLDLNDEDIKKVWDEYTVHKVNSK